MLTMKHKTLQLVSVVIALMAGISSLGEGLYRNNGLVVSAWQGNDIVTFFVVVPMLLISLFHSLRDSKKGRLFWMSSLWYMVYNYMFYLFAIRSLVRVFTLYTYFCVNPNRYGGMEPKLQ